MARWFVYKGIEAAPWASNVPSPSILTWQTRAKKGVSATRFCALSKSSQYSIQLA